MKKNFSLLCVPSIKAKKEWILSCNLSWIKFYISLDIIAYNSIKYYVYLYCDEDGSSNFLLTGKLKVTNRERRSPAESLFVEEHNLRTHWSIFYCIGKNQQFIEFIVIVLFPYATRLGILSLFRQGNDMYFIVSLKTSYANAFLNFKWKNYTVS